MNETMETLKVLAALIGWTFLCMLFPPFVALLAGGHLINKLLMWGGVLLVWVLAGPIVSILAGIYAIGDHAPRIKQAIANDRWQRYNRAQSERERSHQEKGNRAPGVWAKATTAARDRTLPRPRREMPAAWRR